MLSCRRCLTIILPALVLLAASFRLRGGVAEALAATSLPRVVLSAESLAPRAIEQRTGEAVTHDYAQAWLDLAVCLDSNRTDRVGDYFAGEAKRRIAQRVAQQRGTNLRTRYLDGGHHVKAVFYSVDGRDAT